MPTACRCACIRVPTSGHLVVWLGDGDLVFFWLSAPPQQPAGRCVTLASTHRLVTMRRAPPQQPSLACRSVAAAAAILSRSTKQTRRVPRPLATDDAASSASGDDASVPQLAHDMAACTDAAATDAAARSATSANSRVAARKSRGRRICHDSVPRHVATAWPIMPAAGLVQRGEGMQ